MFDKFKQMKQAKALQGELAKEKAEVEKQGTKVVVTGTMQIESVVLNPSLEKEQQEKVLVDCLNEAMRKTQMIAVKKMSEMGGF